MECRHSCRGISPAQAWRESELVAATLPDERTLVRLPCGRTGLRVHVLELVNFGQFSIVTSVPIGVYGQTLAAWASGSSTQPRLCGVPKEARVKACRASPPWK